MESPVNCFYPFPFAKVALRKKGMPYLHNEFSTLVRKMVYFFGLVLYGIEDFTASVNLILALQYFFVKNKMT